MNGNLDFWSNNLPTTLMQLPVYERMFQVTCKKCHLLKLFPTLQYWLIALSSISSPWYSKDLFSAMIISPKECSLVACLEESKCYSFRNTRLSTTLSTETFTRATQIRWIISLTLGQKGIFSFFGIDLINFLLSNIQRI